MGANFQLTQWEDARKRTKNVHGYSICSFILSRKRQESFHEISMIDLSRENVPNGSRSNAERNGKRTGDERLGKPFETGNVNG